MDNMYEIYITDLDEQRPRLRKDRAGQAMSYVVIAAAIL